MQSLCVVLIVAVFSVTDGRLVFPPGSDMGYIVPGEFSFYLLSVVIFNYKTSPQATKNNCIPQIFIRKWNF